MEGVARWVSLRCLLAVGLLLLGTGPLMAGEGLHHSTQDKRGSKPGRIVVRLEVRDAQGKPYQGRVRLTGVDVKDASQCSTNQYGLGFVTLLPGANYAVSVEKFSKFTTFTTKGTSNRDESVEIQLPPERMAGRTASEGNGLVLFTYLDSVGKPWVNQQLTARNSKGEQFSATTDKEGKARLNVPLGDRYTFSVRGLENFDTHTFTASPPLQTAELKLEWGLQRAPRAAKPKADAGGETPMARKGVAMKTRQDSVRIARHHFRKAKAASPNIAYCIPQRPLKPTPKITKQVETGIYLLRQSLHEAQKEDPKYATRTHMEVLRPLLRNGWNKAAYVVDVTCSMDPHIEQYLLWLTLSNNSQRTVGSAFFNDGDGKPDSLKVLGRTGGIHFSPPNFKQTVDTLLRSISHGCSGGEDENDVEALLAAQARYPEASSLVLIADNTSPVRDMALLGEVQMPVHVLLCGAQPGRTSLPPHEDYITIAYRTGGSIHTLEEDIPMQQQGMAQNRLIISQWQYRYIKGRFVRENK